jgi:hypothetical protein
MFWGTVCCRGEQHRDWRQGCDWEETLTAAQITELKFANEASDLMARAVLAEPADKAFECSFRSRRWWNKYDAEYEKDELEDTSASEFEIDLRIGNDNFQTTSAYIGYLTSPHYTSTSKTPTRLRPNVSPLSKLLPSQE